MENSEEIANGILEITVEDLAHHLRDSECQNSCSACGGESWNVGIDNDKPALVACMNARDSSFQNWFFWEFCGKCGFTRMYAAHWVWARVAAKREALKK